MATILRTRTPETGHVEPIGGRNLAVESLRGIAALWVVGYHFTPAIRWPAHFAPRLLLSNGDAGVTLFFILSGFLLWRPFARAAFGGERPSIKQFFANRALRIIPAYWAALTAVILTIAPHPPGGAWRYYLFAQNYSRRSFFGVISPAWSLCVEAVFYLALPLAGLAAIRLARRARPERALYGVIAAWFIASFVYKAVALHSPSNVMIAFNFPAKAHLFAFGMLLATWHARDRMITPKRWAPWAGAAVVVAAVAVRYHSITTSIWFDTVSAIGFTLIVYSVAFDGAKPALARPLGWKPLVWCGTISYSIYLLHRPLVAKLQEHGVLRPPMSWILIDALITLAAVLAVAAASYYLVERPFLGLRKRWS